MKRLNLYASIALLVTGLLMTSCSGESNGSGSAAGGGGNTIMETGTLVAINTRAFIAPRLGYWEMKIVGILDHGELVSAGDSIIQLDPTPINQTILTKETELETQFAVLEKLMVDKANTISEINSAMRTADATFALRKIELEASQFETERARQVKELEFKQAEIQYASEKRKLELAETRYANELKIQNIKIQQIKTEIQNSIDMLSQFTFRTPVDGVLEVYHKWGGGHFKVGDVIYSGNQIASVPEFKWMRVETRVNETDFLKIRLGQKVNVRLDAMPKVVFEGEVAYIGKLCRRKESKSRQRIFDVQVKLLKSDERLKPGMTVSCEYLAND